MDCWILFLALAFCGVGSSFCIAENIDDPGDKIIDERIRIRI
jgi:hypothetical protein